MIFSNIRVAAINLLEENKGNGGAIYLQNYCGNSIVKITDI